jgi:hypothetical protein
MVGKCANPSCSASRQNEEGKLFRVDIDLGNATGGHQCKTTYLWLCAACAQSLRPKVEVVGNTVTVLLAAITGTPPSRVASIPKVN